MWANKKEHGGAPKEAPKYGEQQQDVELGEQQQDVESTKGPCATLKDGTETMEYIFGTRWERGDC